MAAADASLRPSMRPAPPLLHRLPEQYFTRVLAAVEAERGKPGERLMDLGLGNPDLPPPPEAIDALRAAPLDARGGAALERGTPLVHGSPPLPGHADLKAALAARYAADHGVE